LKQAYRCIAAVLRLVVSTNHVEEQYLSLRGRFDPELSLSFDCGAIACGQRKSIQDYFAERDLNPPNASAAQRVPNRTAHSKPGAIDANILVNRKSATATLAIGKENQPRGVGEHEALLLVAGCESLPLGQDSDLQKMHRVALGCIELTVLDAGACAHALHLTWTNDRACAERIIVRKRALENIRNNLHVAMAMHTEPRSGSDAIFVDNAQGIKSDVRSIVVVGE
jgi:hypothetical protein